jgi:uncharacterized membrane protein
VRSIEINKEINMQRRSMMFTLILVSLFSVALVAVRVLFSGQITYIFLIWNLFLAWLPLLFAWLALRWQNRTPLVLGALFLWLLFFPNAPYLVTDLIHLRPLPPVPLWYDLILLFDYALLGLFLAFVSLHMMQNLVDRRFGSAASWAFVLSVLSISGLGVFIGRFLRWNSWDLFLRPFSLLGNVWAHLAEPRTLLVSGLMALLLLFAYLIFVISPGHGPGLQHSLRKPQA